MPMNRSKMLKFFMGKILPRDRSISFGISLDHDLIDEEEGAEEEVGKAISEATTEEDPIEKSEAA